MEEKQDEIKRLAKQIHRVAQSLKNTQIEHGYVLKALEEELVSKGVVTPEGLQKQIMRLEAIGWRPDYEQG